MRRLTSSLPIRPRGSLPADWGAGAGGWARSCARGSAPSARPAQPSSEPFTKQRRVSGACMDLRVAGFWAFEKTNLFARPPRRPPPRSGILGIEEEDDDEEDPPRGEPDRSGCGRQARLILPSSNPATASAAKERWCDSRGGFGECRS